MSAIFGTYNFENKPISSTQIGAMSNTLSHRGNDDVRIWTDENVGLGHRMLWTTPESLHEKLPKTSYFSNLTITADARIDNREDLIKQLGIPQYHDEVITDSDIILFAYEKWGEQCPEKLLGDFVFVIWDKKRNSLFCARDHFGVKPFYYYSSAKIFAFATEIKALFCLPELDRTLNDEMVANYLVGNFEDKSITFYKNIFRLPAGHSLNVNKRKVTKHCYFQLDQKRELTMSSNEEYSEGLREIFTEAVRCRMRSSQPIGSMLSGGLDSSSIASVARNIQLEKGEKLHTFSVVYDRITECDERKYIDKVLAQGGFISNLISGDDHSPVKNLEQISWHTDSPVIGPGFSSTWEVNQKIVKTGVKVIFDGHDGDSAVSYGYNYLNELADAGKWLTLAKEAGELSEVFSMSQWDIVKDYIENFRWKPFLRRHPKAKIIPRIWRRINPPKPSQPELTNFSIMNSFINEEFAKRIDLSDRLRAVQKSPANLSRTAREYHYHTVTTGGQSFALEQCDALAGAFGLEVRYPFWDKRLIEYCLSLPADQKCNQGWNRVVMRRAMSKILPKEVCWRKTKTDFTPSIIDGMIYDKQEKLKNLLFRRVDNENFFNYKNLLKTYHNLNSQPISSDDMNSRKTVREFWGVASLLSWLQSIPTKSKQKEVSVM